MIEAAVSGKGQITIPPTVSAAMGLRPKDRVLFTTLPDGTTIIRAKNRSLLDLAGSMRAKKKVPVSKMRIGQR
jgi:antitoxin PrlF